MTHPIGTLSLGVGDEFEFEVERSGAEMLMAQLRLQP